MSVLNPIVLTPIGWVRNEIHEARHHDWSEVISEIELLHEFADGLLGLEQFSHAMIVYYAEPPFGGSELRRHPRDREGIPKLGVFSQRAKHRPNPILVTMVTIVRIDGNVLTVSGLDAHDGTPVLDIKPYVPDFDHVVNASVPRWMSEIMDGYF